MIWRFRGGEMTFERVRIMGILNLTPDSFSDGGEFSLPEKAFARAKKMEEEGADLIDVGAESTRPGAAPVSMEEELDRLIPVVRTLVSRMDVPLSVDTTKPEVARATLEEGAHAINDVDGLTAAPEMAAVVREFEAGLILMHRRGNSETMQQLTHYKDVVEDVFLELDKSFHQVLDAGVEPEQVVLDPGIGFAKTAEQSVELIGHLKRFLAWGRPLLAGPSRKSFIGALIDKPPAEREWGTAAAVSLAVSEGAHMVRVHNVGAMRDVVSVAEAIAGIGGRSRVRS